MSCLTPWNIHDWGNRETRLQDADPRIVTVVTNHTWSLTFIAHETFRLEEFDMFFICRISLFAVVAYGGKSGDNQS
jgi:hypothetical protein